MTEPRRSLLFDENLAARLVRCRADIYPGSVHIADVGLLGVSDLAVWQYARDNGFILVSKDEDFHRLSVLLGFPPKAIWVRLGNSSTEDVIRLLRRSGDEIAAFLQHEEAAFPALG